MPIQMSAQSALFNQTSYAGLAGPQPPTVPTVLSSLIQQQQQLPTSQQTRSTRTLPQNPIVAQQTDYTVRF